MNTARSHQQLQRLSRRRLLQFVAGSGAGITGAALLAACGGAAAPGPGAPARTATSSSATSAAGTPARVLTIAQEGDIANLDPHVNGGDPDTLTEFNLFDTLTMRQPDLQLHPGLATSWRSLNPTTWEFKLRQDVTFHNGDRLTAKDAKFSAERTLDPKSGAAHNPTLATIDHIETPDDFTIHYVTKEPDPLLPARLATTRTQVIPADYFQKVGLDGFIKRPVGSGPVKFVEWQKGDRLVLARHDGYWGGKVAFEQVVLKPIPEMAARLAALQRSEAQIVTTITPDHWKEVNAGPGFHGASVLRAGHSILAVNVKQPPLDTPLVRQALSAAIDRGALVRDIYGGQGIVANSPIPKGSFAYDPNLPPYPFAPDKAKRLLEQAGYHNEPIILESDGVFANEKQLSEAVVGMWQDVGVNSKVEVIEFAVRAQKKRDKSFKGLFWFGATDNLLDPDGLLWFYTEPGGIIDYGWRNPDFARVCTHAQTSLDPAQRLKDYQVATRIFNEALPFLPIFQPNLLYGVANSLDWTPIGTIVVDLRPYNLKVKG